MMDGDCLYNNGKGRTQTILQPPFLMEKNGDNGDGRRCGK
jgi:hypothetical protein